MSHKPNGKPTASQDFSRLQIMQVNVGRDEAATDLALYHAFDMKADIFLLQEPWIEQDLERKLSQKHTAYQAHAPEEI